MECERKARDPAVFQRLLRRARIVVGHYRYRGQPVDAQRVVQHVWRDCAERPDELMPYRAALEEAVRSLLYGLR